MGKFKSVIKGGIMAEIKKGIILNLVCVKVYKKSGKNIFNFDNEYYEVLGSCDELKVSWFKQNKIFKIAQIKFFSEEINSYAPHELLRWF